MAAMFYRIYTTEPGGIVLPFIIAYERANSKLLATDIN